MNNATTLKSVLTTLCMLLIFSPSDAFISFQGILSDLMIADGTLWCGAGLSRHVCLSFSFNNLYFMFVC